MEYNLKDFLKIALEEISPILERMEIIGQPRTLNSIVQESFENHKHELKNPEGEFAEWFREGLYRNYKEIINKNPDPEDEEKAYELEQLLPLYEIINRYYVVIRDGEDIVISKD